MTFDAQLHEASVSGARFAPISARLRIRDRSRKRCRGRDRLQTVQRSDVLGDQGRTITVGLPSEIARDPVIVAAYVGSAGAA